VGTFRFAHPTFLSFNQPSLRAKRSNPELGRKAWIASSLTLLAMTMSQRLTPPP
jgi:hypothetical protein